MPSRRPPRGNYWKQCTTALASNRQHCFLIYREEVHTVHTATPSQGGKRGTFLIPQAVNALLAILAGLLLGYCTLCRTVIIDSRESESVREGGKQAGRRGGRGDAANHPPKWARVMNRLLFPPFPRKLSPLSLSHVSRRRERDEGE